MAFNNVINFMGQRKIATIFSIVMLMLSFVSLGYKGLNLGLDFTGGTQIELHFDQPVDIPEIRKFMHEQGYDDAVVVLFGTDQDVSIRSSANINNARANELSQLIVQHTNVESIEVRRVEFVGPQIGDELREDGGLGMLAALLIVMLYVSVRFQYKFSVGAVLALFHDVIITIGLFSIFGLDFDLTVLAAVLAVIGYSLNDTIVIFDRIRENFKELKKKETTFNTINISLSQTFGRTLITSLTTLLVLIVLFFLGGESIHNFSAALIIGVIIGTYSSIYVASSILLVMHLERDDLLVAKVQHKDEPYSD